MTAEGRERGNVVADGGADAWSAVEPEGVATIARSRVCGTSRPVAESTGDMPISAVSASSGHLIGLRKSPHTGGSVAPMHEGVAHESQDG